MPKKTKTSTAVLCPKCGSHELRCVFTKEIVGHPEFAIGRRRKCVDCGHQWYSAQQIEQVCRLRFVNEPNGKQSLVVIG